MYENDSTQPLPLVYFWQCTPHRIKREFRADRAFVWNAKNDNLVDLRTPFYHHCWRVGRVCSMIGRRHAWGNNTGDTFKKKKLSFVRKKDKTYVDRHLARLDEEVRGWRLHQDARRARLNALGVLVRPKQINAAAATQQTEEKRKQKKIQK